MLNINNEDVGGNNQSLMHSQMEFEILFNNSPSPHIIIDKNFNILNFNHEAQKYFNLKEVNESVVSLVKDSSIDEFFNWINVDKYFEKDMEIELKCNLFSNRNFRRFRLKGSKYPCKDKIFLFFIDIQDEYDSKLQLELKLNNEMEQVRLKNDILIYQSKLAEIGESIQNIAHQWRQPLNHISTTVMNLEYKIENDELSSDYLLKNMKEIDDITNNLSIVLDDFLKFFKSDTKKQKFDLVNIYKDLIKFTNYKLAKRDNISIVYSTKELFLESFRNEITQVLLILINNSIDAIDINKDRNCNDFKIVINHYKKDDHLFIELSDNAGGIEDKIINKIWEPYFSTKTREKGVGIGLYIVKVIVENHLNGTAIVESKSAETKFTIKIPFNI